ncbi:MAG: porin family protein [Flavobacterium sp.]
MRKLFIVALLALGFSSPTFAQQSKGDVEFGFNVGYNSSAVSNSDGENTKAGNGLNVGASADYYFSNRWSIKGKMIYDQKGWNDGFVESYQPTYSSYTTDFNLNYLTIPVMANWHFGSKRNWYLNFGPYAGFLLSAEETARGSEVKDAFNSTDFGLAIGIGVKIPVTDKLKISLEYDDQTGFSDIFKINSGSAIRNSRGSFNIGVNFLMK